uniref:BTB/POZ domain-containing protein 7-like n=1 Tax=Dermatophagoides pteronyssinus TaxID=6956 RepID=A0A6P6XWF1_DERPT|nr:BTB/POZ domain-containing protein 7-like [Dermatophagoides pteronyssinus]
MGANTSSQYFGSYQSSDSKSSVSTIDTITDVTCSSSISANNNQHHGLFLNSNESTVNSLGLIFSSKDRKLKKLKQKIKTKLKKCSQHSQVFSEFAQSLSIQELAQIYNEYRAAYFMKELSLHAESARPIASSIRNDLSELYDLKHNSDIILIYKGVDFPVHKAIVCVRCPFFRELLGKLSQGSTVTVNLDIQGLRVELFNDLLKYLYSGELAGSYDSRSNSASYEALIRISQQCGVPNPLSHDLKHLLETGIYSDASLCFQISNNNDSNKSSQPNCCCTEQTEFSCHQAILSARSPFFRNVIIRQQKRNSSLNKNTCPQRMKIILDESIIPRRLGRILLHVMYRDSENLLNLIQSSLCKCNHKLTGQSSSSSSNSKESHSISLVKEVMNLYEIARFLEIDFLVQTCEDMIINFMNLDTLILILKWSEQSHGSPWVKRQALTFLKEEFSSIISQQSLLYQLDYIHLRDVLKSDFIEASELEILKSIIKWGEHYLIKKQEEHEPNLLLSHSLTRKSLKKKEINDSKLRDLISELIDSVRIGHCLPIDSDYLMLAIKRGLIQIPSYMIKNSDDDQVPSNRYASWFRNNNHFIKIRFFTHYFEECKLQLEEKLERSISLDENIENLLMNIKPKSNMFVDAMPDNLYMLEKLNLGAESLISDSDLPMHNPQSFPNFHFCLTSTSDSSSAICYEEIDKIRPNLPILEERIMYMMNQREQELRTSPFCIRALQISHSRCEALRLIQLRVVREFGLPDLACDVLHLKNSLTSSKQRNFPIDSKDNDNDDDDDDIDDNDNQRSSSRFSNNNNNNNNNENSNDIFQRNAMPPPPPRPGTTMFENPSFNITVSQCDPFSYQSELRLEELTSQYEIETQFSSTESHPTLSDYIPDIAFVGKEI